AFGDMSYPDFDDLRKRATMFETLGIARMQGASVNPGANGQSRITLGLVVDADFFPMLGLQPVIGRRFMPEEDSVPARDAVVMIGYGMWQRDFAGSTEVIGKKLRLNSTDFTITGVVPQSFTGVNPLIHSEFYIPRMMGRALDDEGVNFVTDRS